MKNVYGLNSLMEALTAVENETKINEEIREATLGVSESFTYADAVSAGMMSEDEVERDMDVEDVDVDDEKIQQLVDQIPADDEEDELADIAEESLEVVDTLLESVIED